MCLTLLEYISLFNTRLLRNHFICSAALNKFRSLSTFARSNLHFNCNRGVIKIRQNPVFIVNNEKYRKKSCSSSVGNLISLRCVGLIDSTRQFNVRTLPVRCLQLNLLFWHPAVVCSLTSYYQLKEETVWRLVFFFFVASDGIFALGGIHETTRAWRWFPKLKVKGFAPAQDASKLEM